MKKFIKYSLLILIAVPASSEDGLQLFGSRRDNEKDKSNNESSFSQDGEATDFSSAEVSSRKILNQLFLLSEFWGLGF